MFLDTPMALVPPPATAIMLKKKAKHKWHIDNALDAKITARVFHNGERGFYIHILWLNNFSISQSYRGFTDFGGVCSAISRLNTASESNVQSTYCTFGSSNLRPYLPRQSYHCIRSVRRADLALVT
jgi:hypothetical protein